MTVADAAAKRRRIAKTTTGQGASARLRAAAHAWLGETKRPRGGKKEPRAPKTTGQGTPAKASAQATPARLRAAAHAWLGGTKRPRGGGKKEPRAPKTAGQGTPAKASAQATPARLRAAAHAWLGGTKRPRGGKKEPRAPKTAGQGTPARASAQATPARLRAAAHAWLGGTKRPRGGKKEPRVSRGTRQDPVARFRAGAWDQLGHPARRADVPVRSATTAPGLSAVARKHLKGVLEALIFVAERPVPARELARSANAEHRVVRELLAELVAEYDGRGFRLDEVAGGYVFRTSAAFAPFVREVTEQKPVKMSRAQTETLAIVAYRQPITRPEIDEIRGVDSGAALKSLLERDLVRILGKKDEPGRPMLYGTTAQFLEFFGLKALGELPTLREFTELTDESRRAYERELGEEPPETGVVTSGQESFAGAEGSIRTSVAASAGENLSEDVGASSAAPREGEVAMEAREDEMPEEISVVGADAALGEAAEKDAFQHANDVADEQRDEDEDDEDDDEDEEGDEDEEEGDEDDEDEEEGDEDEEEDDDDEDEDDDDEEDDEDEDEDDEDDEDEDDEDDEDDD
ncbi:SMC-Scp complex subunit ScpB [Sorangium atrum]|uniref:SMC-Scp complex subunit ScpB n=1 Tax=Sorangium atrum TaxID=2995308 RepID=A0ABT5CCN7_9BACT|nr:SMC-Scp complex subunit ScpB [Sorangium aterium]MDC0683575.1 SMC-Scp complex subunit ScpB [Sorangium aterium]